MHASVWIMDKVVFIGLIVACFAAGSASAATILPSSEVDGLREIGVSLGKTGWDFNANPCEGERGWVDPHTNNDTGFESNVTCNCFVPNDTFCHVIRISLKAQNLSGTLPPASQLLKLPYLGELDLSRNYLNGTIPPEWGSLNLTYISLLGNRLTGSIPPELGNMSSLISFVVDINQLSGALPPELGNLSRIERLHLCSNNFSGKLPGTLVKLTTLTDFRISDNQFSGRIPEFIQNWTNLTKLMIQASGLEGPIPSAVSVLKKMTDLRISDLKGAKATFPDLSDLTSLSYLILRSCNIIGLLPPYLGNMVKLKTLDLSFNKLNGTIPQSYDTLSKVDFIYLTGNFIAGAVPDWILNKGDNIDLSYNNLTISKPEEIGCLRRGIINLFKSSLDHNNSGIASCLKSFKCTKEFYSFNINCGGMEVSNVYGNTTFEADIDNGGPSKFVRSETNWAFSNTGQFMDNGRPMDPYTIDTDASRLSMQNSKLYLNARISAISLTYYGFCLIKGNYTITLHFAEIQFFDNNTYFSLGRRIFDIYIQGVLVEENFNIAERAGGFGIDIVRKYPTQVNDGTLEIRFHWSGKGTTGIPVRGVYGPLISAISVISDSMPQSGNRNSISIGAVTGIIVAGTFIILLLLGTLWWKQCIVCKNRRDQDLQGLDLQTGTFTLRQIKAATNNFDVSNKIGEGGFGSVYKGILLDGTVIAVKQLSSKSKQGNREFVNEIGMISALQHPHLVKLFGCCIEGNQLLLVYEYMENNSLARALFGPPQCQLQLDWPTRHKICVGIARGLAYLHEESRLKIVHRDIKATNVLLDKHLNSKISDFGLAKLDENDTHISTRIAGTYGYMAPEYAMRGYLTDKADVYSFGIVALEIVCGRSNTSHRAKENSFYLLDWANFLKEKGDLIELVDPRLAGNFKHEEVITMIKVGLLCTNASASHRPAMSSVVSMLEGKAAVQELPDPTLSDDDMKVEEMRDHFRSEIQDENLSQSMYVGGPSTGSSTSAGDLYPISLGSSYLEQRN